MKNHEQGTASFEDSFNKKALTHSRIVVNQLAILLKLGQMHSLSNVAVVNATETLLASLRVFFEDRKSFSLTLMGDYLFLEDSRIKYNMEDFNNFEFLISEFKKRKLGVINFSSSVTAEDLLNFTSGFLTARLDGEEPYQSLSLKLVELGVAGLGTEELKAARLDLDVEKVLDTAVAARKAYIRVLLRVKKLFRAIGEGQPADIRKLKRAVQSLVDSVYNSEGTVLRLCAVRREQDAAYRHYVNVCALSLGVGKRLGLSKYQMARLGMAALLHDIGHQRTDDSTSAAEADNAPGGEAIEKMLMHPRHGVQTLLRLKGLNEVAISAMIVAYEHHRNLDYSGYPEHVEDKPQSLFSMIVRIADAYDAMTSSGIYGSVPLPPDRALALMVKRSGQYYDEELLSHFVKMTGIYPVGTVLVLSDGRPAVVFSRNAGREALDRPKAVLLDAAGAAAVVDLAEKDGEGNYAMDVARTIDPNACGINVNGFLV